jgi:outer membrane protein OmpA-like peptidoglycan-associated protein
MAFRANLEPSSFDKDMQPADGGFTMKGLQGKISVVLTAGFIGFLAFGATASAEQISSQQILDALTTPPKIASFADRLRNTRSPTFDDRGDYTLTSTQSMPAIDLEVYFDYNSAAITSQAAPQLRELGIALTDPKLKGAVISINGHTDGVGGDIFNRKLSEHRATMIKEYLVGNFQLSPSNLRAVGFGKSRLKNKADPSASENRRVEVVNLAPQAQAQR